ncbi:hypothetical protein P4B35_08835 [Pontiellaceae bacterium B12227]|nr:hypothetical protein [Pontiellaceae bacterium B12227]
MEFPVRKLFRHRKVFESLDWWKHRFGRSFSSVKPFLTPCDDRMAEYFPSPEKPAVPLSVKEVGLKFCAVPPEGNDDLEDLILDWEDVQAYRLNSGRLRASLRKTFNVKPAGGRKRDNLMYLGRCQTSTELRHVYVCLAYTESEAHKAIEDCTDPEKIGCILFATRRESSVHLLKERGISSVPLRECLSQTKGGFTGTCPGPCAECTCPDPLESRIDSIVKKALPDASRGSKTKHSASAGGKARAQTFLLKYEEARHYMWTYHRKNPALSFTEVRKRAAQHVSLSESALKKHLKKGDFPDW